jgi:hydrogenase expression/formation protein HypD
VPAQGTLEQARAAGGRVEVVLGPAEAVALARRDPLREVVFFAVGFETTACTTAAALLDDPPPNFSALSVHRLIAPALEALLDLPDLALDGFLLPGHAATVTGPRSYAELPGHRPCAIAGFEPVDILLGVLSLATQALGGVPAVDNQYPRAVRAEGNPLALGVLEQVLRPVDAAWRGLGVLPRSGLEPRAEFSAWDARVKFRQELADLDAGLDGDPPGCRCAEVMTGRLEPEACPLFGAGCTPEAPLGACMVGSEGTCRTRWIWREA